MITQFITLFVGILVIIITTILGGILGGIMFYFVYNPIAPKWLYFIPIQLQVVGFWESICLFIVVGLIGRLISELVPVLIKTK